jgi:hypothetical protein
MDEMSELLKNSKPMNVYNKLTLKNDELSGPSSRETSVRQEVQWREETQVAGVGLCTE